MIEPIRPFGLLFEEKAVDDEMWIIPTYDEDLDFSYVINGQGQKVPFVEMPEVLSTKTKTAIKEESTDTDISHNMLNTRTMTEAEMESTDTDEESSKQRKDTKTTGAKRDRTDYNSYIRVSNSFLGTRTATKMSLEGTDTDPGDD